MILPTYFKRVWSLLITCFLAAAPCAAHQVNGDHTLHSETQHQDTSVQQLANHYTQLYLQSGNDDILDTFETKLINSHQRLDRNHNAIDYWLAQAWLAQARHHFDDALRILNTVTDTMPHNGQAWLTKANVFYVKGQYRDAQQSCKKVLQHVSIPTGLLCKARLAQSLDEKRSALNTVDTLIEQQIPNELKAWAYSIAAELAVSLQLPEKADRYFLASLDVFPAIQVRAQYMDFLIGQQRFQDALSVSHSSRNPALHVRELIAQVRLNSNEDPRLLRKIRYTHQQFGQWHEQGEHQHAREMALFYLDVMLEPKLALTLATINLENQREPEDQALLIRAQQKIKTDMEPKRDS